MNNTVNVNAALQWLDKGDVDCLAKEHGISRRQARNVLKGKCKNFSFLHRVIEAAETNMRLAERTQILENNLTMLQ